MTLNELHKKALGVKPVIIGMFWNRPDELSKGILKAIENDEPYNETKMLSEEDESLFNKGMLLF